MDVVDAYAHCGIRKYKPYAELDAAMRAGGVARCVICEHRGEYDHSYIESVIRKEPERFRGVFLVDLDKADAIDDVTRWARPLSAKSAFSGIRLPVESLRTHRKLWLWAAGLGLNLVVDGDIANGVPLLDQFAREMPRTTIQITHLAQLKDVRALAARPNVHIQISGMHQFGHPPYKELRPVVEKLWREFGASRLLYASNFPVMGDNAVYLKEIELLRSGELGIPASAAKQVMHDNATRLWFSSSKP